jgi:hypothetical protein
MTKFTDGSLIRTRLAFGETISEGTTDFDLLDRKGRRIGSKWRIFHMTVTPVGDQPSLDGAVYMQSPDLTGERVAIAHTVTRGGVSFGSGGCYREVHADVAAAVAAVNAKNAKARARYARMPDVTAADTSRPGPALLDDVLNGRA